MKKIFLIFILLLPFVFSQQIEYFVNDYTGILTYDEIADIEPILKEVYDSGRAEYAVVIVNSTNGEDIEGYTYKLAEGNLGDEEKNNGLLLLIALDDHRYRFEVGRGLEPELPDIIVSRIGRYYIEANFKNGDYALGIKEASLAVKDLLMNNTASEYYVKEENFPSGTIIFIIIFFIILFFFIAATSNSVSSAGRKNDDYFTAAWVLSQLIKGGKGGSGGSGGGFGGFGGGSFGGGGAGGGW